MREQLGLVLLPTKTEHKGIYKHSITNNLSLYQDYFSVDKNWYPQNLYAISDKKPKIGDYFIELDLEGTRSSYSNKVYKCVGVTDNFPFPENCKKVVIATDGSLVIKYDERYAYLVVSEKSLNGKLPTFTNDFINTYIERYNNEQILEQVEVEYDCDHSQMPKL